jgi:tetratricopeptide (TPR) repeat protein
MNEPENSLKIHNFYLIGKENYELGKYPDKISHRIMPPAKFNFGETIQEIGLDIKLEYENFKYYEENESIVSFEPFHFKDFDSEELNIWTYFELFFHQRFLFGVSYNSNKIEIYDRLRNYLVNLYGDYKEIPDQDNSTFIVAWFFDEPQTSIYLEIEQKGNGDKFIVLTYYDTLLHMSLKNNHNIYPLVRGEAYRRDNSKTIRNTRTSKGFLSKLFNQNTHQNNQNNQNENDFELIKKYCENILSNDNTKTGLIEITNYLIANIKPNTLNLEIGDWLIKFAVKIQESQLFKESEQIYDIFVNWQSTSDFIPSKERIELIASVYKNLINVYGDNSKNSEAINCFNNCIKLLDNNASFVNNYNYSFIAGQVNYNIARVFNNIGKNEKAIEHSKKALAYFEPFVSPWINRDEITTILLLINNLGNYYSENVNYDEAAQNYAMGMRFAIDNNRYYDSSVINMNLANTWVKQRKYDEADKQYNVILDLISKGPHIYEDYPLKGQVLVNMADMFKRTEEKEKEIRCLDDAISFYENVLPVHPKLLDLINNLKKRKAEL